MPTRKGFLQGYNAQIAVTGDQLIVAVQVGQSTNDQVCFLPMMRAVQNVAAWIHAATSSSDHMIVTVLADAGYNSEANLTAAGRPARRRATTCRCEPARGQRAPLTHRGRPSVV
jgi:hypothetical protein